MAILVSETCHVPRPHRTYPGNGADQTVLGSCLNGLGKLHDALDLAEQRTHPACRTLVTAAAMLRVLHFFLPLGGCTTLVMTCFTLSVGSQDFRPRPERSFSLS